MPASQDHPFYQTIRQFCAFFEEAERFTPMELLRHQIERLQPYLKHAVETTAFHRDRLAPFAGLGVEDLIRVWPSVPTMTRRDLSERLPEIASTAPPAPHGRVHEGSSSGSTGMPIKYLVTDLTALLWDAMTRRQAVWWGIDQTKVMASIALTDDRTWYEPPVATHTQSWGRSAEAFDCWGPGYVLSVQTSAQWQYGELRRLRPDYMMIYTSLVRDFLERDAALPPEERLQLKAVLTNGEVVPSWLREETREVWDAPLFDAYATTECGVIATQCPDHPHYHLQCEGALIEILDEEGRHVAPGETGEVAVTAFYNYATCLIRYKPGDHAVFGEPCSCGRPHPVLTEVKGRSRNLFTFSDGSTIWPTIASSRVREILDYRRWQVAQTGAEAVELRFESPAPVTSEARAKLEALVRESLNRPDLEIAIKQVDAIPRTPSGKYLDYVREYDAPAR